jgi:hypothetical protein
MNGLSLFNQSKILDGPLRLIVSGVDHVEGLQHLYGYVPLVYLDANVIQLIAIVPSFV